MRAIFCILFSAWFLLGAFMPCNDAEELAKVPLLFQHFIQHQQEDPNIGFLAFVKDHYGSSIPEGDEHQDLPFAEHLQPCLVFIIPVFSACLMPDYSILPAHIFPEFCKPVLTAETDSWQPPRLV